MGRFWLTKKALLEALRMTEGQPQTTWILFDGDSEVVNGKEYTITKISVGGKEKVLKQDFEKISLANGQSLMDD